jgi:hypothetical protein
MQNINFEYKKEQCFEIKDFPDAEKVIALRSAKAQDLADIALCRSDLLQAEEYLDSSVVIEDGSTAQRALWRMAVITFMKCFGKNNARAHSLDIKQILIDDAFGQEVFIYFKNLRDKNIAHDDNPIDQCLVGAVINKVSAPYKIEKIITCNLHGEVYAEGNISNLKKLIKAALTHVENKYDEICVELTSEMEPMDHVDLIRMEDLIYNVPTAEDVSKNRKRFLS